MRLFPWFIGPRPRSSNYPKSPHICSKLSIRSTLHEVIIIMLCYFGFNVLQVLQYQGVRKERSEVEIVAVMIMGKIQEMNDGANSSCMGSSLFLLHLLTIVFYL